MATYTWAEGAQPYRKQIDAQAVGDALEHLQGTEARLTPPVVVAAARAPESPLHVCFEWDDAAAAEKHREQQARDVLRHIRVEMETADGPQHVHAFVHFSANGEPAGYTPIARVLSDTELYARACESAKKELAALARRYEVFRELRHVLQAAVETVDELTEQATISS